MPHVETGLGDNGRYVTVRPSSTWPAHFSSRVEHDLIETQPIGRSRYTKHATVLRCERLRRSVRTESPAAHVDERFQESLWGEDEAALARRAGREAEFRAASAVYAAS